jgi:uncharacterized membrane protein
MNVTAYTGMIMTNIVSGVAISGPWVSIDLTLEACSDGMSDIAYDYSTIFTDGTINYTWCANLD